jgi:glycolate oxidase FAD binding subunit
LRKSMASIPSNRAVEAPPVIDGIVPSRIVTPATPQEVAEVMAAAASESDIVAPIGGATKLALGNVPERIDVGLSTSKLMGIIDYEPTDLTLSVRAGSRFADVNAQLAEHGQTLPIDVAAGVATIGGLIATGLAGPRRSGSATFRDLLIGISAAHPSGTVTKAGGMVVKNVTGFDLMRLYLGSLGTLGVIVSANFKVVPLARSEATIIATFSDLDQALQAANRVQVSRARPVALEVFRDDEDWRVAARLEGREETVRLLATETQLTLNGDIQSLETEQSREWWRNFTARESATTKGRDAVLRCSTRPRLGRELLKSVVIALQEHGCLVSHLSLSHSTAEVTTRFTLNSEVNKLTSFREVRESLLNTADNLVVLAAPAEWKTGIDVWGKSPETLDIMRALKAQFDPRGVLNRGRFAGGI